jgi:hypothetical protein
MLINDHTTDEELSTILNNMEENIVEIEELMAYNYEQAIFLGASVKGDLDALDAILITLRLCEMFYMRIEDYTKVGVIKKLLVDLHTDKASVVEEDIRSEIVINLN